jgi:phosphoadenosine phosphosulfate reductase
MWNLKTDFFYIFATETKKNYKMIQLPVINEDSIIKSIGLLCEQFPNKVIFTTSFGLEDQVITDLICKNHFPVKIITLDTGRLFEETYRVYSRTIEKYKINIESVHPDAAELSALLKQKGPFSFYESVENRKECCRIRKVKPLQKALEGFEIWITGLRSEQSDSRAKIQLIEHDESYEIIKYNPLYDWTLEKTKAFIKENNVPYNVLHDRGYPSIGCAPCTRAINEDDDIRSGRWWWENGSKKECGLHAPPNPLKGANKLKD